MGIALEFDYLLKDFLKKVNPEPNKIKLYSFSNSKNLIQAFEVWIREAENLRDLNLKKLDGKFETTLDKTYIF